MPLALNLTMRLEFTTSGVVWSMELKREGDVGVDVDCGEGGSMDYEVYNHGGMPRVRGTGWPV